jgi:uncharacterized lipoprotein YmbA
MVRVMDDLQHASTVRRKKDTRIVEETEESWTNLRSE